MPFVNLPGVQVNTVDGGLAARRSPRSKSTLIIGTSDSGQADDPYQVTDRAAAAKAFGFNGTLIKSMEEAATFSDNIILFRMGTKPMTLANVGQLLVAGTVATNVARTTNILTVTSTTHGLIVGDSAILSGFTTPAGLNGTYVVLTVPTANTFTVASVGTDIVAVAPTGSPLVQKIVNAGVKITFREVTSDASTRYQIWYKNAVLYVWLDGNLVYANDAANSTVIDLGSIFLSLASLTGLTGLQLGSGSTGSLANSITVQAASVLAGTATTPAPALVAPVIGTGLTGRQTWVALVKALDLLQIFPVQQVYCPDVIVDAPNVAYYVASDPTTVSNNPVTNADALDWMKITVAADGTKTYQWANDTVDDQGNTVAAMGVVANATARIAAGFREVHAVYQLANFCNIQGQLLGGCIAFIGTSAPVVGTNGAKSFKLVDTRNWVGFLPTYDINGNPTVAGKGLLGIPVMAGTTAAKLNSLCSDSVTGYRLPGMFQTVEQVYDGGPVLDRNQNKVDIGAYVHVFADWGIMSNGFASNYAGPLVGFVAGYCSTLDEKSGLTNKPMPVLQLWKPSLGQMDSLTFANINVLRFKNLNISPALLHGETAASRKSDYTNLLRQRIKFLMVKQTLDAADAFIGESSTDGLQLEALKTKLDNRYLDLQKRGYISRYKFNISTTDAEARLGHSNIDLNFMPADELVQLNAFIGISRQ